MLLNVLKKDVRRSLSSIALAMENADSETSHYATSVVTDVLSDFRGTAQNAAEALKRDPGNVEVGKLLLEHLLTALQYNLLTGAEKSTYAYMAANKMCIRDST